MARDIREGDLVHHQYVDGTADRFRIFRPSICNREGMRCHLVARAERLAEVWPTDEAFRRFAAEVADAVQAAMGRGVVITDRKLQADRECRCPLGCLPNAVSSHPRFTIFQAKKQAFTQGFDGSERMEWHDDEVESPYYRLGQAYRRRFVAPGSES